MIFVRDTITILVINQRGARSVDPYCSWSEKCATGNGSIDETVITTAGADAYWMKPTTSTWLL